MSIINENMIFYTQLRFRKIVIMVYILVVVLSIYTAYSRFWGQTLLFFSLFSHAVLLYGIISLLVNRYKVVYSICLIVLPGSFTFLPNIQQAVFSILYRLF